ncbi:MAG: M23 family metallopeptidase [Bacteroidota bacterium]
MNLKTLTSILTLVALAYFCKLGVDYRHAEEANSGRPMESFTDRSETDLLVFPVKNHGLDHVISVFGDPRGSHRTHQGIDIKAPRGTEIVAVADGFIERIREGEHAGKSIYLRSADGNLYFYAHLDSYEVEEMQAVVAGELIATVGDTGNAERTTPHLHFEILIGQEKEAVDPLPFFLEV